MLSGPPRRRRARPVADAPVQALLPHSEDLAKGWLLALLEQVALDQAPGILAADLTRDGPRVCAAVLRAIVDDTDLRRLEPGGALTPLAARVGDLAGASGPEATSRAVDALHGVLWAALRDELRGPDPDLVSELAERLSLITELLRAAALRRHDDGPVVRTPGLSAVALDRPEGGPGRGGGPGSERGPGDERGPGREGGSGPERVWPAGGPGAPAPQALWVGALQEEIDRAAGSPLSLLLAELEDAERVVAAQPAVQASATFGEFAQAVRGAARRQDILVRETDSRAWLIVRETGRAGAQALASRIAEAVREGPPWHGAAMVASVGVAVLGEDGRTPAELIEAAEEARFGAAASGVGVIQPAPELGADED